MKQKTHPSKPLRDVLLGAIEQRRASLRNGRSQRKDYDAIWTSIGKAEAWLRHFPAAGDDSVREWCLAHHTDVGRIVPGNCPTSLARLIVQQLAPKKTGKVIQMIPTTTPAA